MNECIVFLSSFYKNFVFLNWFALHVCRPDSRHFSIVSDMSWTRWYLDSDLSRTWSLDSPNVLIGLDRVQQYMLFFLFQNKTINLARLFGKLVM